MAFIKAQMGNRLIPSFSQATDEEITQYIEWHNKGVLNLNDCWDVGEERTVHLSAMSATGVTESHAAQDVTFVIMNGRDFFKTSSGGSTAFVIGVKNCLAETGELNGTTTNVGGYENSDRREWCDEVFMEALPAEVKKWFSKFKYKAGDGNQLDTATELENYFILPSYGEIYGESDDYVASGEDTDQLEYYSNSSTHKIKTLGEGENVSATDYFLRSPSKSSATSYNGVSNNGSHSIFSASALKGITILGCIGDFIKSFGDCTDEEVTEYLRLHKLGTIDLTKHWHVGDMRTIHINAIPATGNFIDTHAAQDATFVILHGPNAFELSSDEGGGYNTFVIGMKDMLDKDNTDVIYYSEDNGEPFGGLYNFEESNAGGWKEMPRRAWCDNMFKPALPTEVQKWFKKFKYKASDGGGLDTSSVIENYFTLPSVSEIFNPNEYANYYRYASASEDGIQMDYYKVPANRSKIGWIKKINQEGIITIYDNIPWGINLRTAYMYTSSGDNLKYFSSAYIGNWAPITTLSTFGGNALYGQDRNIYTNKNYLSYLSLFGVV